MKIEKLLGLTLLFSVIFSFASCEEAVNEENEENEEEGWYDSIPDGNAFLRANTVRFYYIDGNGESLIKPGEPETYPVSWHEELKNPIDHTLDYGDGFNGGLYNGNHNGIYYDKDEALYYCTMTAYGDEKQSTYTFPVYVNGGVDQMEITYKYTNKGVIGGKYWGKIISWKYNGKHVYSDDDELYKKVFITKANGKTTVSLTR